MVFVDFVDGTGIGRGIRDGFVDLWRLFFGEGCGVGDDAGSVVNDISETGGAVGNTGDICRSSGVISESGGADGLCSGVISETGGADGWQIGLAWCVDDDDGEDWSASSENVSSISSISKRFFVDIEDVDFWCIALELECWGACGAEVTVDLTCLFLCAFLFVLQEHGQIHCSVCVPISLVGGRFCVGRGGKFAS